MIDITIIKIKDIVFNNNLFVEIKKNIKGTNPITDDK